MAEDLPRIRVHCAGVRTNQTPTLPVDNGRVFFSESQYDSSPYIVRVALDSVSFVHRGTHVVERRFVFPGRILHAVLADFPHEPLNSINLCRDRSMEARETKKAVLKPRLHPHLCVLVRSDCLNVYTAAGEVFEVSLPFQANRLFPMDNWGLLLQRSPAVPIPSNTPSKRPKDAAAAALARKNRRASTSNRGDGDRYKYSSGEKGTISRPRYFTLRHPLDEVKPVALKAGTALGKSGDKFLSDSALEAVNVLEDNVPTLLVAYHRWEQRFCVFRMKTLEKVANCSISAVKVVDGPTWTRYRARSDLEELRVRIEPDWSVEMLWKSPRVGPLPSKPMFLSPILSPPSLLTGSSVPPSPIVTQSSAMSSGNATKVSFIASGVDGFPVLCIMDKDAETLLLKPASLKENALQVNEGDHEGGSVCILRCRDAVPIRQHNQSNLYGSGGNQGLESLPDIVVLEKDRTLVLYKAHQPVCTLTLPDIVQCDLGADRVNASGSEIRLAPNVQLNSIGKGYAYEIVYPDLCGNRSRKIWRCEHPLTVVASSLLQQVFDVLDCIVPPVEMCAFKAHIVCSAQQKAENSAQVDVFPDSGFEWQAFCESIAGLLPVGQDESVVTGTVDDQESVSSSPSSFDKLCQSEFHSMYQYEHAMLFATMDLPVTELNSTDQKIIPVNNKMTYSKMAECIQDIFAALHLLCEDLKLSTALYRERLFLAELLLDMSVQLGVDPFIRYYEEDNCILKQQTTRIVKNKSKIEGVNLLRFAEYGAVPDLFAWLQNKMTTKAHNIPGFPTLFDDDGQMQSPSDGLVRHADSPLRRSTAICRLYDLLYSRSCEGESSAFKLIVYLTQDPIGSSLSLDDLPVGLSFPIVQAIRQVKHHPPPTITEDICAFVGREDLSIASVDNLAAHFDYPNHQQQSAGKAGDPEDLGRDDSDGLEDIISRSQPLFPADQRMKEAARLLRSSRPLCLKLEKTPDLSDLDYAQQQQARLLLLCKRSMALSVARGMVTLGSFDVSTAQTQIWRLNIPALPLQGRKPPTNAIVELDLSGYAKELTYWPQFHNGCATGLRLPAHDLSGVINRHWIKYHRPSVNDVSVGEQQASTQAADTTGRSLEEAYAAHAGLLLGIGLRGHLKCLSMADVYNYLSLSNEFVTVAIMLGMASTAAHGRRKRKQQNAATKPENNEEETGEDTEMTSHFFSGFPELASSDKTPLLGTGLELALERSVSKMLCLHVPSLLPSPFGGFSVPASTQTAALLGLGILYQGTGYRLMTELLLAEIARSPSSTQFVGSNSNAGFSTASFDQLEGYALAAGMALGLVVLGRGQPTTGDPGLADLKLEEKLHKYIVGGAQQFRDTNAAGSCLYRGRRWQTFGAGGNGCNSSVNGSATGNSSSNANTGGSPGAGRDTKHSSERNGARSSGEHVNVGVTACASALALAFMYMQTDNMAVAAQLAVPDTLVLLDYVRPDILLVRTLAKNLVMWNDISPTTDWIEQHQVPAQLLHAYRSILSRNGDDSSSHADLHSICEAYANIIAGAVMSIGLRFAGTENTSARETLRKYVLQFRELRAKASSSSVLLQGSSNVVAAATERATVERCLAVCAQSLALVDAGTGNVETLTLLRSITLRQRVDAAMSYGNHMALSMAIGLLFLGGGRATVSRSKEAISALVISLYPMCPMNTADNKYHLQAFRHLYVLAIDTSRLLETVDVNTKTSKAVQVRVDFQSGDYGSQPPSRILQTPCLLPDITTIKRFIISDPEFYPIEILTSPSGERINVEAGKMRTANSLRLELLRNKNVVFLKRRQRKDTGVFNGAKGELEQLHGEHVGYHGAANHGDRLWRVFRSYFKSGAIYDEDEFDDEEDEVADWGSNWWAYQLSSRTFDQVREEVQFLLPPYLNALHALFRIQQVPQLASATEVVDLNMLSRYCAESRVEERNLAKSSSSLPEFGVWLTIQTEEALGALWRRTSVDITSLASARVQLLVEATCTQPTKQTLVDAFFVSVLVRYFASPSVFSLATADQFKASDRDWKVKFQRVLAACSTEFSGSKATRFQLSTFLDQDECTEAEKTFWLKLVSFFLFSN